MIYRVYILELTSHALAHMDEFWSWAHDRVPWFFAGCDDSVADTLWLHHGDTILHAVAFEDTAAYDRYKSVVAEREREPRHSEETFWYTITNRFFAEEPPLPMHWPRPEIKDARTSPPATMETCQ